MVVFVTVNCQQIPEDRRPDILKSRLLPSHYGPDCASGELWTRHSPDTDFPHWHSGFRRVHTTKYEAAADIHIPRAVILAGHYVILTPGNNAIIVPSDDPIRGFGIAKFVLDLGSNL